MKLLVCLKVTVSDDQLITSRTVISCKFGCGTMSFPANRMADPANWQLPFGTVNRGSEFTHMRSGPVGYHNKMRQLESTCDRRLMATAEKHFICSCYVSLELQTFLSCLLPKPGISIFSHMSFWYGECV